jgi:hypothetical protein
MLKFYKISHSIGNDIKIIVANTRYEAVGYYLMEEVENIGSESLDQVETLSPDYKIEISHIGFPVYKTLEQLYAETDFGTNIQTIIGLDSI